MTEPEFRELVPEIAAEELDKQTAEGLLPVDTDQKNVQYFFERVSQSGRRTRSPLMSGYVIFQVTELKRTNKMNRLVRVTGGVL